MLECKGYTLVESKVGCLLGMVCTQGPRPQKNSKNRMIVVIMSMILNPIRFGGRVVPQQCHFKVFILWTSRVHTWALPQVRI